MVEVPIFNCSVLGLDELEECPACLWIIAAALLGLGLGFVIGKIFRFLFDRWEGADTAVKSTKGLILVALGGAGLGGTAIFSHIAGNPTSAAYYVIALAVGGFFGWRHRGRITYSKEVVTTVLEIGDHLKEKIPDIEKRTLLIMSVLESPEAIQRDIKMDTSQWAKQLESAVVEYDEDDSNEARPDA